MSVIALNVLVHNYINYITRYACTYYYNTKTNLVVIHLIVNNCLDWMHICARYQ